MADADDVVNGRTEGAASDAWTARQVDTRRDQSVDQLLDEWETCAPGFEAVLDAAPPEIMGQVMFDAVTHEHDIRSAVGQPGARDSAAVAQAWAWLLDVRSRGEVTPVLYVTEVGESLAGAGEPEYRVATSRFEILRATTGRRSAGEIASYGWDPASDPELLLGGSLFRIRDTPLGE
jgi:hypothetical protein